MAIDGQALRRKRTLAVADNAKKFVVGGGILELFEITSLSQFGALLPSADCFERKRPVCCIGFMGRMTLKQYGVKLSGNVTLNAEYAAL